jgi:hypothetical protein
MDEREAEKREKIEREMGQERERVCVLVDLRVEG